jgi:hypothetical protein
MKKAAFLFVICSIAAFSAALFARTQSQGAADSPHVIEVVA